MVGWNKLNRKCHECGRDRSDIEFLFMGEGQLGKASYTRAYHWSCLPPELSEFQVQSEHDLMAEAQTPMGKA